MMIASVASSPSGARSEGFRNSLEGFHIMSNTRRARTITITVLGAEGEGLGQLRVAGPGGETTWALDLSNWLNVIATATETVSAEPGQALGELGGDPDGGASRVVARDTEGGDAQLESIDQVFDALRQLTADDQGTVSVITDVGALSPDGPGEFSVVVLRGREVIEMFRQCADRNQTEEGTAR